MVYDPSYIYGMPCYSVICLWSLQMATYIPDSGLAADALEIIVSVTGSDHLQLLGHKEYQIPLQIQVFQCL